MARVAQKPVLDVLPQRALDPKALEKTGPKTLKQTGKALAARGAPIADLSENDDPKIRVLRARRRINTQINAELLSAGGCQETQICDVSRYGAGLAGFHDVKKGEFVAIKLLGGQIIHGNVRWHRGNRCGIAFFEPLAEDAPLVIEAGLATPCAVLDGVGTACTPAPVTDPIKRLAAVLTNSLRKLTVLSLTLRSKLHHASPELAPDRAMERACREQGFAWLTDDDIKAPKPSIALE